MANGQWGGALDQRIFRAVVSFTRGGQKCQTGFHLRDVGINTLSPEDVATQVAEWATTQFVKLLHQADAVVGIDVQNMETTEGHSVSPANAVGLMVGAPAPSFISVAVSMKGTIRKRYGSGRMLWPVSLNDSLSGNSLVPVHAAVHQTVIADLMERFVGPSITTSMHLVHAHKALAPPQNTSTVPASWYDISSIRLNTTLSSLRRRKVGNGS